MGSDWAEEWLARSNAHVSYERRISALSTTTDEAPVAVEVHRPLSRSPPRDREPSGVPESNAHVLRQEVGRLYKQRDEIDKQIDECRKELEMCG